MKTGSIILWHREGLLEGVMDDATSYKCLHSNMVLKGKEFEILSKTKSPTNTYITHKVYKVIPMEKFLEDVLLSVRVPWAVCIDFPDAPDLNADIVIQYYHKYLSLPYEKNTLHNVDSYLWKKSTYATKRHRVCSELIMYILYNCNYLQRDSDWLNILPNDIYHMKFFQKHKCSRTVIFKKNIHSNRYIREYVINKCAMRA